MIRCIAIDLDDTLLRTDLTIGEKDQAAIRRAVGAGVKVLLASGRMVQSMRPYVAQLGLDVPLIAYNGAVIQEALSGETLYHRPVPREQAMRLVPFFRRKGVHLNAYMHDQLYMDELTSWGEKYAANAGVVPHPAGDLCAMLLNEEPHKMLGISEPERIDALQKELETEFGGQLQFVKSKPAYLEILALGVSKGSALAELAKGWGLEAWEVMAIGDAPNDLEMIAWAGVGVAIGNARQEVRRKADLVVADHDHCGVAEAIGKVVFAE